MQPAYNTLTQAINGLKARGYAHDFNIDAGCLVCNEMPIRLHPEAFTIVEAHRFEGMNDPDDSAVVYAIESKDGDKGLLVDAYGVYADAMTPEMVNKFGRRHG